jgi:hypothetical protein
LAERLVTTRKSYWKVGRVAYAAGLLNLSASKGAPRVRIPHFPPFEEVRGWISNIRSVSWESGLFRHVGSVESPQGDQRFESSTHRQSLQVAKAAHRHGADLTRLFAASCGGLGTWASPLVLKTSTGQRCSVGSSTLPSTASLVRLVHWQVRCSRKALRGLRASVAGSTPVLTASLTHVPNVCRCSAS